MKKIKFIAFILFTALITSCSSDDGGDDSSQTPPQFQPYFNFTYDKGVKTVNLCQAVKQGDLIEVVGYSSDIVISFKFNVYGNLYEALTNPVDINSTIPWRETSGNFSANTFTFTLENLDIASKTVRVKFSGKVYDNGYDDQSDFVTVSGAFNIVYTEYPPDIEGLGTYAKLDGKDWHGLSMSNSISGVGSYAEQTVHIENDGEYSIGLVFPQYHLEKGTYTFTNNTFANRVSFAKYDVATKDYITYDVSGTITYTVVKDDYASGTFSLTATHPVNKTKIVISNGKFTEMIN